MTAKPFETWQSARLPGPGGPDRDVVGGLTGLGELVGAPSLTAALFEHKLGHVSSDVSPAKVTGAFTFADLFAGIGGFHVALAHAGAQAVFVSEIDPKARKTYLANWVDHLPKDEMPEVNEDINSATPVTGSLERVPRGVDVLTAGFPCQSFSKSGAQKGMDETRGTLFFNIARFLEQRTPPVILLENVRNLVGPRHTHEWNVIIRELRRIGYRVSRTPSVFSPHLLPPRLGGTPQVRDRVFILGTYVGPGRSQVEVPPTLVRGPVDGWDPKQWNIEWVLDREDEIENLQDYDLRQHEREWIDTWDWFVRAFTASTGERLPGFPLWEEHWMPVAEMEATEAPDAKPDWKKDFLYKNARFYEDHMQLIDAWREAKPQVKGFPTSRRKLEWQAQDHKSLWDTVMHFRPSGIRAKAPTYLPALVAITQTSIIGPRQRRITPHEAARLQGLPRSFSFGEQRDPASYKQVGNGVCVGAAWYALRLHVHRDRKDIPDHIVDAILGASPNPSPGCLSAGAIDAEVSVVEPRPESVRA